MTIDWVLLGKALALVMVIEGLGPFLFPNQWRWAMREISAWPERWLRGLGAVLLGLGVASLWMLG